jgi:hypothetical protein
MTGGYLPPHFRGLAANTLIHQTDMCAPPSPLTLCPSLLCPMMGSRRLPLLNCLQICELCLPRWDGRRICRLASVAW